MGRPTRLGRVIFRNDLPFADKRVRKALNLAVNRPRLVEEGFHGYAVPQPGADPSLGASPRRSMP